MRVQKEEQTMELTPAMVTWLAGTNRGISANTIFSHLTGVHALGDWYSSHPHDPSDLARCRRLLEACPELAADFGRMAEVSDVWAALVPVWDELCALMDDEAPDWRDGEGIACRTYNRMKELGC